MPLADGDATAAASLQLTAPGRRIEAAAAIGLFDRSLHQGDTELDLIELVRQPQFGGGLLAGNEN